MLKLIDIIKYYGDGTSQVAALYGVSISFRKSEFVAVLGPSGCGKTTLLNIVGGLDRYSFGDLIINGKSTKFYRDNEWDSYRNRSIGFVFQTYNLIPHLSVLNNVELALTISGVSKEERKARAAKVLKEVGLKGQERKRPNQLSGGQMQRVAIARALINNPEIILADEPTGALDSVTSIQIMELLKEVAKDRLVIMVTHNPLLAERYSSRIVRMLDGQILDDSQPFDEGKETAQEEADKNNIISVETNIDADNGAAPIQADGDKDAAPVGAAADNSPASVEANENAAADNSPASVEANENAAADNSPASVEANENAGALNNANENKGNQAAVSARSARKRKRQKKTSKTSMSVLTAVYSSFLNLVSKRGRTVMTCFAGSIGIIGIALVLSVSAGFSRFIQSFQQDNLAEFPLSVIEYNIDMNSMMNFMQGNGANGNAEETRPKRYPDDDYIIPYASPIVEQLKSLITRNQITQGYVDYLDAMEKSWVSGISYVRPYDFKLISKKEVFYGDGYYPNYHAVDMLNASWQQIIDNPEYMAAQYDVLNVDGRMPEAADEVALSVDRYNRIKAKTLDALGISYEKTGDEYETVSFEQVLGHEFSVVWNDSYYTLNNKGYYESALRDEAELYDEGMKLQIVGIIRQNRYATMSWVGTGLIYTEALTEAVIEHERNSAIVAAQRQAYETYLTALETDGNAAITDVNTGKAMKSEWQPYLDMIGMMGFSTITDAVEFTQEDLMLAKLQKLGGTLIPSEIYIYPSTFANKSLIMSYLNAYNEGKEEADKIFFADSSGDMFSMMATIVDAVSYVLVAFSAISLVVSSIMIGIITYVSVIERTKEIGVLRSLGARKRDISRIFNAETLIIGASAGVIGVFISWIFSIIISAILKSLSGIPHLSFLEPLTALFLVLISIALTVISGLIPARIAANKDPVVALRTE